MSCPACTEKRVHTAEDWKLHPYAGHGYQERLGWTHKDLAGAVTSPKISGEVHAEGKAPAGGEASGFRLPPGTVFVSAAPLTDADIEKAQKLLKEHPEYGTGEG